MDRRSTAITERSAATASTPRTGAPARTAIRAVLSAAAGLIAWGTVIEPRFILDTRTVVAEIPRLPPEWAGHRIAVLADWQVGMWWANIGMIRRAVDVAIAARPAAVLLAGDFFYASRRDVASQATLLEQLVAPLGCSGIPTFAVLGNHDWGTLGHAKSATRAQAVRGALERGGARVLRNEAAALPPPARPHGALLYVVGIGAHQAADDAVAAGLADVPVDAPRVVFMHNPRSFEAIPAAAAPVAVAAHTHGGQVRLPMFSRWFWLRFKNRDRMPRAGWIRSEENNALYVNRGIGFSRWPVRINCPPEVTLMVLQPKDARNRGPA
jgi:predicted MPP superfamily phosphohydrolase